MSGAKYDPNTDTGCWIFEDNQRKPQYRSKTALGFFKTGHQIYCSDDDYSNEDADMICCVNSSGEYHTYDGIGWGSDNRQAYEPTCGNITKCEAGSESSGQYDSQDALDKDPCGICD